MEKLKIHYLYYDYRNVIPIHSFEVIHQMAKQGCEVTVFGSFDRSFAHIKEWEQQGIRIRKVASIPLRILMELSFLLALVLELAAEYLRQKPDLIYVRHGSLSLVSVLWGRWVRCPVYLEVNDIQTKRISFPGLLRIKKAWVEFYEWVSLRLGYKILPVTDGINDWVRRQYGRNTRDVLTIPNGVNMERFRPETGIAYRDKYSIPVNKIVITYLGSLFPWSGIDCLLEAIPVVCGKNPQAYFAVGGGEEPDCSRLAEKARAAGMSDMVRFYGRIDWKEASGFINTADVCVAPACFGNTETGIASQKVLAYLACGKPVVGSDIPGLGDMLERETVGVSFRMGNPASLSAALIGLLADPGRIIAMGERGRKLIEQKFSWQMITRSLIEQFRNDLTLLRQ